MFGRNTRRSARRRARAVNGFGLCRFAGSDDRPGLGRRFRFGKGLGRGRTAYYNVSQSESKSDFLDTNRDREFLEEKKEYFEFKLKEINRVLDSIEEF